VLLVYPCRSLEASRKWRHSRRRCSARRTPGWKWQSGLRNVRWTPQFPRDRIFWVRGTKHASCPLFDVRKTAICPYCVFMASSQRAGWLDVDFTLGRFLRRPLAACRGKCCQHTLFTSFLSYYSRIVIIFVQSALRTDHCVYWEQAQAVSVNGNAGMSRNVFLDRLELFVLMFFRAVWSLERDALSFPGRRNWILEY
jgi:hypothetical protein